MSPVDGSTRMPKLANQSLLVASHNAGKLREIDALVAPFGIKTLSAGELDLPEPEETEETFEGNALLKARAGAAGSGLVALADDSGICVEALGGAPGIYSARWAGPEKDFAMAMRCVEEKLQEAGATKAPARRAFFVSVIALVWPDGAEQTWRGEVHGTLLWPPRGDKGFGYDPMFLPDGETRTFGEMTREEKQGWSHREPLSHRARAFRRFAADMLG